MAVPLTGRTLASVHSPPRPAMAGGVVTDGIVGQHIIRPCSPPSRRLAKLGPRSAGLAVLTPAPRALHTGNCPTMPDPDPVGCPTAPPVTVPGPAAGETGRVLSETRLTASALSPTPATTRYRQRNTGTWRRMMKIERQSGNEKRRDARIRAADEDDPGGERMYGRGGRSGHGRAARKRLAHDDSGHEPADPMYVHWGWRGALPLGPRQETGRVAAGSDPRRRSARRAPRRAAASVAGSRR